MKRNAGNYMKIKCFLKGHDYKDKKVFPYQTPFYKFIKCERCGKEKEIMQDDFTTDFTWPNIIKVISEL